LVFKYILGGGSTAPGGLSYSYNNGVATIHDDAAVSSQRGLAQAYATWSGGLQAGTVAGSANLKVIANTVYFISLSATIIDPDYGSVTATADPYIGIDSNFLANHPNYNVLVSHGIINSPVAAIPECPTWVMILLGFIGLGFAAHCPMKQLKGASERLRRWPSPPLFISCQQVF
jgi:hypothetical protein